MSSSKQRHSFNSLSVGSNGDDSFPDAGTNYIHIQSLSPLSRSQKIELRDQHDVQILELLKPCLYLCYYGKSSIKEITDLDFVKIANYLNHTSKISPTLADTISLLDPGTQLPFNLILYGDITNNEDIVKIIRATKGVDLDSISSSKSVVTVSATKNALELLQRIEGVRRVAPVVPQTLT